MARSPGVKVNWFENSKREAANRSSLDFDIDGGRCLAFHDFRDVYPDDRHYQPVAVIIDLPFRHDRGDTSGDDPLQSSRASLPIGTGT